jgi:acyl-CoA thioester hydrolase
MDLLINEASISIRWSDLDANRHVRHSAYYDFGAQHRIELLARAGLTMKRLAELDLGPVLFREECIFKRELHFSDEVIIRTCLSASRIDFSRFSMRHELIKNRHTISAVINIDAAWMSLSDRKIAAHLPSEVVKLGSLLPHTEDYKELEMKA